MEMRRGSVRIVLAGLLLVACKSGGGAEDPKMGEPARGGGGARGEFIAQGAAQGIDVASVRYLPGAVEVEFAASPWDLMIELAVGSASLGGSPVGPPVVTYVGTGERLDTDSTGDGIVLVRAPRIGTGSRHRIVLEFEAAKDAPGSSTSALVRVAPTDPADRGNVEIFLPSGLGGDERSMPDLHVFRGVVLADFSVNEALAEARRSAEGIAIPAGADRGVAGVDQGVDRDAALLRFCEAELLTRAPRGAADHLGGAAAAWFGGMVAPVTGEKVFERNMFGDRRSPASDEPGHAVSALAAVLEGLYAETLPAAERAPQRLGDDAWAVPRYMALRERIGVAAFREALREIVDRHRGGAPISYKEVAAVFQDLSGEDAGHFVETWLAGPARPVVRTQWRFDRERSRLLLRLHQVHEAEGNVPAAFPLSVPLRVIFADGSMQDHTVEITVRRELLEVPCDGEPLAVTFDPDDRLVGVCSLEVDE